MTPWALGHKQLNLSCFSLVNHLAMEVMNETLEMRMLYKIVTQSQSGVPGNLVMKFVSTENCLLRNRISDKQGLPEQVMFYSIRYSSAGQSVHRSCTFHELITSIPSFCCVLSCFPLSTVLFTQQRNPPCA